MNTASTFEQGGHMGNLIRSYPWDTTPLGPLDLWPSALINALNLTLFSQQPMLLIWGDYQLCFFNDACAECMSLGSRDKLLGSQAAQMCSQSWAILEPSINRLMKGAHAASPAPQLVTVQRAGVRQQVLWSYSFCPIEADASRFGVGGVMVACSETSDHSHSARRDEFLLALGDVMNTCTTVDDVMAATTEQIGKRLNAIRCATGYWDTSKDTLQLVEEWTDGTTPRALGAHSLRPYTRGFSGNTAHDAAFLLKSSGATFAETENPTFALEHLIDLGNSVVVPMGHQTYARPVLLVQGARSCVWAQEDIALMSDAAIRAWRALELIEGQQRLRDTEHGLRGLLDASDSLFVVLDTHGTVLDCNRAACVYVNDSRDRMVGEVSWIGPLGKGTTTEGRAALEAAHSQAVAGNVVKAEVPLTCHRGADQVVGLSIYPICDDSGQVILVAYEGRDITSRTLLAQSIREAAGRRDEFFATLLHELRNPMAALRSAAQIVDSEEALPDGKHRAARIIQRQISRMAQLMDHLSDFTRITQGKMQLQREAVTLRSIVDTAVECARPSIDNKRHTLVIDMPTPGTYVTVDPLRISQVLCNLLTNAAKYTDPDGRIELAVQITDGELTMKIVDSGIGLAASDTADIFAVFSQVESSNMRSEGGLGIGLALVKGLTELHGGTVEAVSAGLGAGSTFIVRLPTHVERTDRLSMEPMNGDEDSFVPRRVLVVDDNEEAAIVFSELLRIDGHEVVTAFSGGSARELAATFKPDVALLDISLPDMSGYELAKHLQSEQWADHLTLVALTGWGGAEHRQRAAAAGFHSLLVKPVDDPQLKAIFAQTTRNRRFCAPHYLAIRTARCPT